MECGICATMVSFVRFLAEAMDDKGSWKEFRLLLDTGADRTVFSADVLRELGIPGVSAKENLAGVGGAVHSVMIATRIRMVRENKATILFEGQFAAFPDTKALDMRVLGRDLTNLFAVIVDRPQDVVCLIGHKHRYVIVED